MCRGSRLDRRRGGHSRIDSRRNGAGGRELQQGEKQGLAIVMNMNTNQSRRIVYRGQQFPRESE